MAHPDPAIRRQIASLGGLERAAKYGPEITAKATRASDERFLTQVDPEGVLTVEERIRRADLARRAWFTRLAYRSAEARRRGSLCRGSHLDLRGDRGAAGLAASAVATRHVLSVVKGTLLHELTSRRLGELLLRMDFPRVAHRFLH